MKRAIVYTGVGLAGLFAAMAGLGFRRDEIMPALDFSLLSLMLFLVSAYVASVFERRTP